MNFIGNLRSPAAIQRKVAQQFKERRLGQNITQEALSKKSGVSLGTLRRFEQEGEISLKHMAMLASALNIANELDSLFKVEYHQDLYARRPKERKRAR